MNTIKNLRDIDAPIYSYFQALYLSFYSSRLYIDVSKRWKGFGFLYILLVTVILIIPLGIKWSIIYKDMLTTQILEPINLIPKLVIQNGSLVFDKPMPYLIKNNKGQVVILIDTTGQITKMDKKKYPDLLMLINKHSIQFKNPSINQYIQGIEQSNSIFTFDKNDNEIFDPKLWVEKGGLNTIKYLTSFMVYPVLYSLFVSFLITFIPVMALLGQLFSKILFDFKISFKQACRLMAVASTPALTIFFIILTFYNGLTGMGIPLVALLAAYFSFAIVFIKKESKQLVIK